MVRQKHQGPANEIAALGAATPAPAKAFVDGPALPDPGHRVGEHVQQRGGLDGQKGAVSPRGGWIGRGATGEGGEGARPGGRARRRRLPEVAAGGRASAAQKASDPFQRLSPGQAHRVQTTIVEASVDHGGDLRSEHRFAPGDGALRHLGDLAPAGLALGQGDDVAGAIEAAPGLARIGLSPHPPPADIGVEGLGAHAEAIHGLLGVQPLRHRSSHID